MVGMVLALLGPWAYERISVPAQYECSSPYLRLEGDFCGSPILGFQIFPWIASGLISISHGLVTGEFFLTDRLHEILISLLLLFPLLPLAGTLFLIWRGEHQSRQVFTLLTWFFAIGGSLFLGLNNPTAFWFVWGIWLYVSLSVCALIFETLVFSKRKFSVRGEAG